MKKYVNLLLILLFLAGVGIFVYNQFASGGIGEGTKDLTTVDKVDGGTIDLGEYIGKKKLILKFVAVPCDCCSSTIPFMKELAAEQDEIRIVSIVFSGKPDSIQKKFEDEYKVNYPWGMDLDRSIANHYGVTTSPTFVFFDEKGNHLGNYPYVVADKENLVNNYMGFYNTYHQKGSDK